MTHTCNNNKIDESHFIMKRGRETIHSGHFMISNFEAEEKPEEDDQIPMPDPDEPDEEIKSDISMECTLVQKYIPKQNSHNEVSIETTLSKLFNCMQLTYNQKLTSPKWNHFKGVRISWKDKIRLNNLIWRCWHSQFIMKKKICMCQFASPIDLDVQKKPEAIVLEGKYWKRHIKVVSAEYMKWRRYFIRNHLENQNSIDTDSRLKFSIDWSPKLKHNEPENIYDYVNKIVDSGSLRGSVRAEFIQPSLGPLQPSIDELGFGNWEYALGFNYDMPDLYDFYNDSARLPPVPEEGTDELFKNVDFRMPMIESEQMEASTITDITNETSEINEMPSIQNNSPVALIQQQPINIEPAHYANKMIDQNINFGPNYSDDFNSQMDMVIDSYSSNQNQETISPTATNMDGSGDGGSTGGSGSGSGGIQKQNFSKGRYIRSNIKTILRREPHNYDKSQPTLNQTIIYNHILAQTQQQSQSQQQHHNQNMFNTNYPETSNISSLNVSPIQTTTNNFVQNLSNQNVLNLSNNINSKYLSHTQNVASQNISLLQPNQSTNIMSNVQNMIPMLSVNTQSGAGGVVDQQQSQQQPQDIYKAISNHQLSVSQNESYKPYHNPHTLKLNQGVAGYNSISTSSHLRHKSPPSSNNHITSADANNQQMLATKEYRSHSLPINAKLQFQNLQAPENFVVPIYSGHKSKVSKSTTSRSDSFPKHHQAFLSGLHSATSEPILNSPNSALLQQLLTTTTNHSLLNKQTSASSSSLQTPQLYAQQPQHTIPTNQSLSPKSYNSSSVDQSSLMAGFSPNSSSSAAVPLTATPSLSPESMTDSKGSLSINLDSPTSPSRSGGNSSSSRYPRETRRATHIHAEQKRRYNIKNGFDTLHSLIPQLQQNPNAKLSKAAMLQKGADYIKQLRKERAINDDQMETLRRERDSLNNSLSHLQSILPASGAPVSRQRTGRVKEMYNESVHQRTLQNWKFWIFGLIFEPLLNSYNQTVSVASLDELYRTAKLWVDQNCSLVELRPAITNKLTYLSTTTDILSDPPSTLQEEVIKAISLRTSHHQHPHQSQSS